MKNFRFFRVLVAQIFLYVLAVTRIHSLTYVHCCNSDSLSYFRSFQIISTILSAQLGKQAFAILIFLASSSQFLAGTGYVIISMPKMSFQPYVRSSNIFTYIIYVMKVCMWTEL